MNQNSDLGDRLEGKIQKLLRLEDEFKKLSRRVNSLQKTVDTLAADREILEDLVGSVKSLQEILVYNRKHQDDMTKDIKSEVIDQGLRVEEKVNKVHKTVENNITDLVENIKKKKNVMIVKKGFFKRLFRRG